MFKKLAVFVLFVASVAFVQAADEEKKLEGTIECAKCSLKTEKSCMTVIVVKEKDKEVTYYFDKDSHKKYHKDICTEAKKGTVTGKTSKDGEKMVVTVSKLEYSK